MATTTSTLVSPGVEIRERDESLRITTQAGTSIFIPGFASQGPTEEVTKISSINDFEIIYGTPTNAAERYFYYTVLSVLNNGGNAANVYVSRLPYGLGEGDTVSDAFTLLSYPAIPIIKNPKNLKGYDHFTFKKELETVNKLLTLSDGTEMVEPTSVDYDIVLDSNSIVSYTDFNIYGIKQSKLPSLTDNALTVDTIPALSYETTKTTFIDGSILIEDNGSVLKVVLAFPITNIDSKQIGVCSFTGLYNKTDFGADVDYTEWSFAGEAFTDTLTLVKAFTRIDNYVGEYLDENDVVNISNDITYLIGSPVSFQISLDEYYNLITGELLKWSNKPFSFEAIKKDKDIVTDSPDKFGRFEALKHSAFISINKSRSIVNDRYEGYFVGINDNLFNDPSDGRIYNNVKNIKIATKTSGSNSIMVSNKEYKIALQGEDFINISPSRLDFNLDSNNKGSISQIIQTTIDTFDTSGNLYDDSLDLAIFKMKKSSTANDVLKLSTSLIEGYNGSLGKSREITSSNQTSTKSYFLENITETSENLQVMINPTIADKLIVDENGKLCGKIRIYNTKLLSNLQAYEKSYLTSRFSNPSALTKNPSLLTPIELAKNNLSAYKKLYDKTNVSLYLLNTELVNDVTFLNNDSLYPLGTYTVINTNNKQIGVLPKKINRALSLISNDEEYDINIIVEAGLGSVYVSTNKNRLFNESLQPAQIKAENGKQVLGMEQAYSYIGDSYDDTLILDGIEDLRSGRSALTQDAQNIIDDYLSIQNEFLSIANSQISGGRGDIFYIPDVLRQILVKGKDTKVEKIYGSTLINNAYDDTTDIKHSFNTSIYWPIKHLYDSMISSYSSVYAQWLKVNDSFSGEKCWIPVSGYVAGKMASTDANYGTWEAAAGLEKGVVNALDCAFNPIQKQQGDLYKICINSIPKLSNSGITIWGIRTMSKKPTVFDQNTCRRTFLYIEATLKKLLKNYVFKNNTAYTRLQCANDIEPFLETIKRQGGIYSYRLVIDSTNNTPEVIDNGDFAIDLAISPTRTSERIILTLTANKVSQGVTTTEFMGQ